MTFFGGKQMPWESESTGPSVWWKIGAFLFAVAGLWTLGLSINYVIHPARASGPSSNRVLNYQVRLTDASGIPVADGTKNIKISFYDLAAAGTRLHTDCGTTGTPAGRKVVFSGGIGTVLIGDTAADGTHNCTDASAPVAIPATLFNNASLFIGISVEADAEMTPRKRVVATGYSLNSDTLDDLDTSAVGGSVAFVPVTDASGHLTLTKNLTVDGSTLFVDSTNDRVGIGTAAPDSTLYVGGNTVVMGDRLVDADGSATTGMGTAAAIAEGATLISAAGQSLCTGSLTFPINVRIDANANCADTGADTIILGNGTGTVAVTSAWSFADTVIVNGVYDDGEDIYIDNTPVLRYASGNVGIGTSSPGEKLEIVGDIISKGTAWTSRVSPADNLWNSVAYGNGLFVAVAGSGTGNRVMTSPDGINWTLRASAADNTWTGVTYGNGLFVAVSFFGTGDRVMTSSDGITWTSRASAADNNWQDVTYGNGLFVAVAQTGTGNRVMTSPDGITWTARTSAADNSWTGVTYGNGLFVAVATDGTGNRVMTSPDGITWTIRTSAADNVWRKVTYGNGLFVAVAASGTGNRVMTSPDGITWTIRTSPADNNWYSVTYGDGLFVAVANSSTTGVNNKVMTSPDGITWTLRSSATGATSNAWFEVTYGNGMFVAVANGGTGNRVMTSGKSDTISFSANNTYQGGMNIFGKLQVAGDVWPGADDTYDLGSNTLRWRDLYLGPTSLHLVSTAAETGTARDWKLSVQEAVGASRGNLRWMEGATELLNVTPAGNVGIGTSVPGAPLEVFSGATRLFRTSSTGAVMLGTVTSSEAEYQRGTVAQIQTTLTGGATSLSLGDDVMSSAISLPFTLTFFDTAYTQAYVCSNGYVSFTGDNCTSGVTIPGTATPNGFAGLMADLDPGSGGTIKYETFGSTPDRIFVVEFKNVPEYGQVNAQTFQVKLYETSNNVEMHISSVSLNSVNFTQGLERGDGRKADVVPGRNNVSAPFAVSNDAYKFTYKAAGSIYDYGGHSLVVQNDAFFKGNLGIGVSGPAAKLDVRGNIQMTQEAAPAAPTVAVNVTAGNLNGVYSYRISFVTSTGETEGGSASATVNPVNQRVDLSAIPTGTAGTVTSRNIYRTTAGGSQHYLVTALSDNTTTTYTDNIADGSLGSSAPEVNETAGALLVNGSEYFKIDQSGRVAIPAGSASTQLTSRLTLRGMGSNSSTSALTVQNTSSTPLLFVRDDGRVGIGTTAPTATLDVVGDTNVSLDVKAKAFHDAAGWVSNQAGFDRLRLGVNNGGFGSGATPGNMTMKPDDLAFFNVATLDASALGYVGATFDGRYVYFVPNFSSGGGRVARLDTLGTFSSSASWQVFNTQTLSFASRGFRGAVFDGRYVYFVPFISGSSASGQISRFDTTGSFTDSASWTFFDSATVNANSVGFSGASFDGRYIYFVPHIDPSFSRQGQVTRYDTTASFTSAASYSVFNTTTVSANSKGLRGSVFDGRYVYFVPKETAFGVPSGQVTRYDTTGSFTTAGSWSVFDMATANANAKGFDGAVFDGRYIYYVPFNNGAAHGRVTRYDTTGSFTTASSYSFFDTTTVNANSKGFVGGVFDGRYVYLLPNDNGAKHGQITRFDTTGSFSDTASWSVLDTAATNASSKGFEGGVFDGRYVYLAPNNNGSFYGQVTRLHGWAGGQDATPGLARLARGSELYIDSTGNVGIGDISPASLLTIGNNDRFQVNSSGDVISDFTVTYGLDGATTDPVGGSSGTSLPVTSATNYTTGNYIKLVNPTTNCATGTLTCYAKITNVAGNTLTISPSLTWDDTAAVTEWHVPEIGATDSASPPLANRYGRGYFIDGIVTGNGSTFITDNKIESGGAFSINAIGNQPVTFGSGAVTVGGTMTVTGSITSNSTGNSVFNGPLKLANIADPDPSGSNGLMYYNTTNNKFRCYQNGAWTDCITAASGGTSIGAAVTSGTAGSLLFVNSGPVLAQDNANLFWDDANNRLGIGMAAPLTRLDLAGNLRATGKATAVLTGSVDPAASTAVTGVGTLFTTQLVVGDRITVTGETRTVTAIASDTSLTVDTAFSNNANDTSPDVLYALGTLRTSAGSTIMAINDIGNAGIGTAAPGTPLDVVGTIRSYSTIPTVRLRLSDAVNGYSSLSFDDVAGAVQSSLVAIQAGAFNETGSMQIAYNGSAGGTKAHLSIRLTPSGPASANVMVFNKTGRVVVGPYDPVLGAALTAKLTVQAEGAVGSTNALLVEASDGVDLLTVRDDGVLFVNRTTAESSIVFQTDGTALSQVRGVVGGGLRFTDASSVTSWGKFFSTGDFGVDTNTLYVDAVNDKVGIGTATPGSKLTVAGDILISTATTEAATAMSSQQVGTTWLQWMPASGWALKASATGVTGQRFSVSQAGVVSIFDSAGANAQTLTASSAGLAVSGSVGIGTAPTYQLHMKNAIATTGQPANLGFILEDSQGTPRRGGFYFGGSDDFVMGALTNKPLHIVQNNGTGSCETHGTDGSLAFTQSTCTTGANTRLFINSSGSVGMGTTSPGSTLDVKGTLRLSGSTSGYVGFAPAAAAGSTTYTLPSADGSSGQVLSTNGTGTLSWATDATGGASIGGSVTSGTTGSLLFVNAGPVLAQDNANLFWDDTNNRLGIGTASPDAAVKLHVAGGGIGLDNSQSIYMKTSGGLMSSVMYLDGTNKLRIRGIGGGFQVDDSGGNGLLTIDNSGNIQPASSPTAGASSQTITAVDSTDDVGSYTSIALGADGLPVIAYHDITNTDLKVIKCGNAACSSGNTISTVDTNDAVRISIAVPADGFPVISYYDNTNGDLRVTKCGNASCSSGNTATAVDSTDDVGNYTAIAIGSDGLPVIGYADNTGGGNLKVAKCGNAACSSGNTLTTVDTANVVGVEVSIAIGTDGFPIISHQDSTNQDLRVTKCGNLACTAGNVTTSLDTTANSGFYTSIAIGTDGLPMISYLDSGTPQDLKIITCGNTSCSAGNTTTTLDTTNSTGYYDSIAIGTDGLPVISYSDVSLADLKVLKCGNATCTSGNVITTLDSTGSVGVNTSIAIGTDGLPVISYYDATNGDLKVLKCADPGCVNTTGGSFTGGQNLGSLGKFFNNIYANSFWGKQFQIEGFDLAETYRVRDASIQAGDIVRISRMSYENGTGPFVEKSAAPYDSVAIGVVSTKPGIALSEWSKDDTSRPIALAGRVPVKVTAENGPIEVGDAITTSSEPGIGMKAMQSGRILGFAIKEWNGQGIGIIELFVSPGWWNGTTVSGDNEASGLVNPNILTIETDADLNGHGMLNIGFIKGMNGLWSIDEAGKLVIQDIDAKNVKAEKVTIKNGGEEKTAGTGLIRAGAIGELVINPLINERSIIVITFEGDTGARWWVTEKENGKFMLNLSAPALADTKFSYWIISVEGGEDAVPIPEPPPEPPADPPPEPPTEPPPEPPADPPAGENEQIVPEPTLVDGAQ